MGDNVNCPAVTTNVLHLPIGENIGVSFVKCLCLFYLMPCQVSAEILTLNQSTVWKSVLLSGYAIHLLAIGNIRTSPNLSPTVSIVPHPLPARCPVNLELSTIFWVGVLVILEVDMLILWLAYHAPE